MRPVTLDMNGFACFREPASIDFTDADFFALVGPTGSGKSTVIDAMTFALYGSVPRWGRKGMVSLALAPTTGRGTVRLVFDVSGQRYVVARELRRVGSQVSQKAASLERLASPRGRAAPGEPTEVLARDLAGVTETVEQLLGLSYEDFCQCVVLPQGQFADFLHAKASERQEILLRLLGAEHYRQMMMRANQRAGDAGQRAETLDETLMTFGDATPEAQQAARAAQAALAGLSERVAAAQPQIHRAAQELSAAEADTRRLEQDRTALAATAVPEDIAPLDAGLAAARAARQRAHAAEDLALEADRAARAALADGPRRAPLELARERWNERNQGTARLPAARQEVGRLAGLSDEAQNAVNDAAAALETLRAQRDAAAGAAAAAGQRVLELGADHAALTSVAVPDEVSRLDERGRCAADALREASAALQAAELADAGAREALDQAVAPGPLEQARRDLGELGELIASRTAARAMLVQASVGRKSADAALASAEALHQECQRGIDEARRAHIVAGLRPHLAAGQPCPVCEQTVGALPAPLRAPAIEEAQARIDAAGEAVTSARSAARKAASGQERAAAELDSLTDQRGRRVASLAAAGAGPLSGAGLAALNGFLELESAEHQSQEYGSQERGPAAAAALAEVDAALRSRRRLDEAARAAAGAAQDARAMARRAQAELDAAEVETSAARAALRVSRDRLVPIGAPPVDEAVPAGLAVAWDTLATWAAGQAQARAAELAEAREAARAAEGLREKAQDQFGQAEADLRELRADATRAGKAEQEARTRLDELTDRLAKLGGLLRGAPDEDQVTGQLALIERLEATASGAEQRLLGARSARSACELGLADAERAESAARTRLSAARDPLVRLGAPAVDAEGLLAGWTALHAWAANEAAARDRDISSGAGRVAAARERVRELAGRISAELAACGVELAPEAVAGGAPAAVAAALERARAQTRRIADRRAQAADLTARRDAAREDQRVARMLGDLLRSDRFPRWLVTAAVDTLVAEASSNLASLSDGQFDLTHDGGEFYVVDHADADSRRSVRTLSGGETFQASLALALALSSQMSTLAAAGTARLDSIFLDEGFGTLDPETLEVVATTLETLAQGQRMVGVVTHVAALAERVPVRFAVARDARTSSVVRKGLPDPAGPA